MRKNKNGTPDKRFKNKEVEVKIEELDDPVENTVIDPKLSGEDPNELLNVILKANNLKLDFDVVEGTVETKMGIIKLEKPALVIRASYVRG